MSEIQFVDLGPGDYDRAKSVLNKARHPGFVGRELFFRCATTGKATIAVIDGVDSAVMLVAKQRIEALSVVVAAQGRGVGQALVKRSRPRFVNAIGERISFFEKLGYKPIGAPKIGQSGKHSTQLMQLDDALLESTDVMTTIADVASKAPDDQDPEILRSLSALLDETPSGRIAAELEIFDYVLQKAILAEKFDLVLKIVEDANALMSRYDRLSKDK